MKAKNNDVFLMLAIVFAIVGGILIAYSLNQPVIYQRYDIALKSDLQAETSKQVEFPVNINTATYEELSAVPNIGATKASAILEYRDKIGAYTSVEQIMDIRGIGESTYYEIAGYLTV